eukprot:Sspe_Gene.110853::Locus_91970_Transcript_1_1_Confidence_1.000_Length_513::g.110853::m.110853
MQRSLREALRALPKPIRKEEHKELVADLVGLARKPEEVEAIGRGDVVKLVCALQAAMAVDQRALDVVGKRCLYFSKTLKDTKLTNLVTGFSRLKHTAPLRPLLDQAVQGDSFHTFSGFQLYQVLHAMAFARVSHDFALFAAARIPSEAIYTDM